MSFVVVSVPSGNTWAAKLWKFLQRKPITNWNSYLSVPEGPYVYLTNLYFPQILCGTWVAHAAVNCSVTGSGQFADPTDVNCKNYTVCIKLKDTNMYMMYHTACPTFTVFDPSTSNCTTPEKYTCRRRTPVTIVTDKFKFCSYEGYIADPHPSNCTTFIQCINVFGIFTQLRHTCPAKTYYNPNTTLCDPLYKCKDFYCSSPGRFADTLDPTCRNYYYCIPMYNGTFAQYEIVCPEDMMFHARDKICTMDYYCP